MERLMYSKGHINEVEQSLIMYEGPSSSAIHLLSSSFLIGLSILLI